jgi:hypothetical protein
MAAVFYDAMVSAIGATKEPARLDQLARDVWAAHGAGMVSDVQAQDLAERVHSRRPAAAHALFVVPGPDRPAAANRIQRSPEQRSPDRAASLERRRRLAMSGHLPPNLAMRFTMGELAVLKVLADECLAHGACDLSYNELAARSGTCRTVAMETIKLAELDHTMINVQRRPRSGRKHLTNIIRIVRADWLDWLNKGNRRNAAAAACERAKPTFRLRGALFPTPRSQVSRDSILPRPVNSVKRE